MSRASLTPATKPSKRLSGGTKPGVVGNLPKLTNAPPQPKVATSKDVNSNGSTAASSSQLPSTALNLEKAHSRDGQLAPLPNSGRKSPLPTSKPLLVPNNRSSQPSSPAAGNSPRLVPLSSSPSASSDSGLLGSSPPSASPSASSSSSSSSSSGSNEKIQVYVRVRPGAGIDDPSLYNWELNSSCTMLTDSSRDGGIAQSYYYDRIYKPTDSTGSLYTQSVQHLVTQFTGGFNGSLLAYGQTGSGKTHTMMKDGLETDEAIIPLAIKQIFHTMETDSERLYLLRCSFVEIYNEELNDLLNSNLKTSRNLPLREVNGSFKVNGITESIVTSAKEVFACIEKGNANRKVGVSNLNERSSRSHSIFRLTLESTVKVAGGGAAAAAGSKKSSKLSGSVKVSELCLVDLAGSETLSYDFGAAQQKETKHINLSLTQLKSVITCLSKNESFIPYRNSLLTKLLKNSLGGNSKTALICTLNPLPAHVKTSKSTLTFGSMAKTITNRAKLNEIDEDVNNEGVELMMKQYKQKISNLEGKLSDFSKIEEEKSRIQAEYLALQQHFLLLQQKEEQQKELVAQMKEAQKMVLVGGKTKQQQEDEEAELLKQEQLKADAQRDQLNEELLSKLSTQLSSLQSANTELEQSKVALERQLSIQLAQQKAHQKSLEEKQQEFEQTSEQNELIQKQLAEVQQEYKRKVAEDVSLKLALAAQQTLVETQKAASAKLLEELEKQKAIMNEKETYLKQLEVEAAQQAKGFAAQLAIIEETKRKNAEQSARIALMEAESRKIAEEASELKSLNAAQQARWNREMELQSKSGLDKDSYLAQLMDRYERDIDLLKVQLSEAESVRLVQSIQLEDQLNELKRQLATAQKSLAYANQNIAIAEKEKFALSRQTSATKSPGGGAAMPVAQPPAASSSSSSTAGLPALVIPNVIELKESEALLSQPLDLPLCQACSSRDRVTAEKLRSLCNHARKTLDFQAKQNSELQNAVAIYQMQLNEYQRKR